jgi:hypothetical protein
MESGLEGAWSSGRSGQVLIVSRGWERRSRGRRVSAADDFFAPGADRRGEKPLFRQRWLKTFQVMHIRWT